MKQRELNILFLGGAKRVSMARMFKDAAYAEGCGCNIVSYEMDTHVPVACEGRIVVGKRWRDPGILEDIDRVVDDCGISIIVPFVDGAVAVASAYAARFPDKVFVPAVEDPKLAETMFDKIEAAKVFEFCGIPVPATYHPGDPCLRLIAKPRHGSASKGIVEIRSLEMLDRMLACADEYLIQERIDNREEISVDCYVSVADGKILALSPRRRLEVTGGEASRTITIDDSEVSRLTEKLLTSTGLRGAVTVQFLRDLDDGRTLLMEVNPRLGGGAVCSVHSGADIPRLIVRETLGLPLEFMKAQPGVEICRYMQEVVFYSEK